MLGFLARAMVPLRKVERKASARPEETASDGSVPGASPTFVAFGAKRLRIVSLVVPVWTAMRISGLLKSSQVSPVRPCE